MMPGLHRIAQAEGGRKSKPLSEKALKPLEGYDHLRAEIEHLLEESERLLHESQHLRAGSERLRKCSERLCAQHEWLRQGFNAVRAAVGGRNQTMTDDYGDIIHRMMRQLEEDDAGPRARRAVMAVGG